MKVFDAFAMCMLIVVFPAFFYSCGKRTPENNEFLIETQKIIEEYDSTGKVASKEIVDFVYEKPDDFFWKKAVYKDESGKVLKTVVREFDEKRIPVKEVSADEFDIIIESIATKYCPHHLDLLEKTVYNGEINEKNKEINVKYNFDDDWKLVSEDITVFETDSGFKNVDGNNAKLVYTIRYIPEGKYRPAGYYPTSYFVEKLKSYQTNENNKAECSEPDNKKENEEAGIENEIEAKLGEVDNQETTDFNVHGMPVHFKSKDPECKEHPHEEWYKIEKNAEGQPVTLTGFANEKYDSNTENNTKMLFEYDKNGIIRKIEEYRYNPLTKKFDKFDDAKSYNWTGIKVNHPQNFTSMGFVSEHYCYSAEAFTYNEKRVEKYKNGEKIISNFFVSKPGNEQRPKLTPVLQSKSVTKFKIIKKDDSKD